MLKRHVNIFFVIDDIAEDAPGEPENDNNIDTKVSKDTENNEKTSKFYENKPQTVVEEDAIDADVHPKVVGEDAIDADVYPKVVEKVAIDAGVHKEIEDEAHNCSNPSLEIDWGESTTILDDTGIAEECSEYLHVFGRADSF